MKKLLTILLLHIVVVLSMSAQSITVAQNLELLFFEDDYGNTPVTTNVLIKATLEKDLFENIWGSMEVSGKYEYAHLEHGSFYRYGGEIGYTMPILYVKSRIFDYRKFVTITPFVGFGILKRRLLPTTESWEVGLTMNTYVTEHWFLNITAASIENPLNVTSNERVFIGVGYKL